MRLAISLLIYNVLLPVVFVVLLPKQILRMRKRGGYGEQFCNRFGCYRRELKERMRTASERPWWIHAVSVGEQIIAHKLIAELRASGKWTGPVVLSTSTSTGFRLAREKMVNNSVDVVYFPFDFALLSWLALRRMNPSRVVLVEAEVWPNFLSIAAKRGIPTSLVNARLSPRSERRFQRFCYLVEPFFRLLETISVPDESDAERWKSLGVAPARVIVTGSMKHDACGRVPDAKLVERLRTIRDGSLGAPMGRPTVLIASTHADEEKWIASAIQTVVDRLGNAFPQLVVVPRHAERSDDVERDLRALGLNPVRRKADDGESGDCLIVDTTGELSAWYALADLVIIGKSFVGRIGGQNPGEAILLGRPVICGSRMDNFKGLMSDLVAADGVRHLKTDDELFSAVKEYFESPNEFTAMAMRGKKSFDRHQGAVVGTAAVVAR